MYVRTERYNGQHWAQPFSMHLRTYVCLLYSNVRMSICHTLLLLPLQTQLSSCETTLPSWSTRSHSPWGWSWWSGFTRTLRRPTQPSSAPCASASSTMTMQGCFTARGGDIDWTTRWGGVGVDEFGAGMNEWVICVRETVCTCVMYEYVVCVLHKADPPLAVLLTESLPAWSPRWAKQAGTEQEGQSSAGHVRAKAAKDWHSQVCEWGAQLWQPWDTAEAGAGGKAAEEEETGASSHAEIPREQQQQQVVVVTVLYCSAVRLPTSCTNAIAVHGALLLIRYGNFTCWAVHNCW